MIGQILDYSLQENSGVISGSDKVRYDFDGSDWRGDQAPARGMTVDFEVEGNCAKNVYPALEEWELDDPESKKNNIVAEVLAALEESDKKNKTVVGWLAIIVGGLGIHKFYLGFTIPGILYLLANAFLLVVFEILDLVKSLRWIEYGAAEIIWYIIFLFFGFLFISIRIIAIIEGIIYLTKSDEDFEQLYVVEKKKWF